ncbi:MAG: tRNA dihydrouridine synthase DusB [Deltaproteobacteria bacterium RBG_16_71_12]|nr:MAG: tRNA dihydrouridine synthase DusB [Deltaproteobacteria bacterium RBG_16_71_12]
MAGVSEMPFRVLALEMGAGLATTELISAAGIFYKNRRTRQYLTFDKGRERPYSVQLFGGVVDVMAQAAHAAVQHGADIVDVNMGCPVRKVTGSGAGCALSCDLPRAAATVRAMRAAVGDGVPITAKIRSGWDEGSKNAVELARALEDAGCAALAVHARTRAQGYSGRADWSLIARVKQAVAMAVIGNGDVVTVADAHRMRAETGCDAVMIGRGALGNPWLFQSLKAGRDLGPPAPAQRAAFIVRHLQAHLAFHETLSSEEEARRLRAPPALMAVKTFRQHLVWYARGLEGARDFRQRVMSLEEPAAVQDAVDAFFARAELERRPAGAVEDGDGVDYAQAFG